jgi:hypothetical protein
VIDFVLSETARAARDYYRRYAEAHMRPISRELDEREHERPWDFIRHAWQMSSSGESPSPPGDERNLFTAATAPWSSTEGEEDAWWWSPSSK